MCTRVSNTVQDGPDFLPFVLKFGVAACGISMLEEHKPLKFMLKVMSLRYLCAGCNVAAAVGSYTTAVVGDIAAAAGGSHTAM